MKLSGVLNADTNTSEPFSIDGVANVLIYGMGSLVILRSIDGSDFYPMTDDGGNTVEFYSAEPGGVMFNADIENRSKSVKYMLDAETQDEIYYVIKGGW